MTRVAASIATHWRQALVFVAVVCVLRTSAWMDPTVAEYPVVDDRLLAKCRQHMTSECFSDIGWALAYGEPADDGLEFLASDFAALHQWSRAEELLMRIPQKAGSPHASYARKHIAAERLASDLAEGRTESLKDMRDDSILADTAERLLGYPPKEGDADRRSSEGLWLFRLKAEPSAVQALLQHWESLPSNGRSVHHSIALANALVLSGNPTRARDLVLRVVSEPREYTRPLIDLLLLLNEQDKALDVADTAELRRRPFFMGLVAESLARNHRDPELAARVATSAAEAALSQRDFGSLSGPSDLLGRVGKKVAVIRLATRAEVEARRPDLFRPHHLSNVGQIYGAGGDAAACLRLQADALDAARDSAIGIGFIAGAVGYGKGRFDLLPELKQLVALRRFECGETDALNEVDAVSLARNYCGLLRRGLLVPADTLEKPDRWPVLADASACHFERKESVLAFALLRRLEAAARTMGSYSDLYRMAYGAAEVACAYADAAHCHENLRVAGSLLINEVAARRRSAKTLIDFAQTWRFRFES